MLISICIPTYSRLEYLKMSVGSCLKQTYQDFEICISQDPKPAGADIEIQNWCEEMTKIIPDKFRYNLNKDRLGLSGNWNRLVDMARGDYLIIIGDDDLLSIDYLAILVNNLYQNDISVIFCNQILIDHTGVILYSETKKRSEIYKRNTLNNGIINDAISTVFNNSIPMSSALIRRDLLQKFRFDNDLNTPEFEVFLKIALSGGYFYYVNKQLAYYRLHTMSATSGGLLIHKLIKNVLDIKVPARYENNKYQFISSRIVVAVNKALKVGEKKLAYKFIKSRYYPKDKWYFRIIQYVLLILPKSLINQIIFK